MCVVVLSKAAVLSSLLLLLRILRRITGKGRREKEEKEGRSPGPYNLQAARLAIVWQ